MNALNAIQLEYCLSALADNGWAVWDDFMALRDFMTIHQESIQLAYQPASIASGGIVVSTRRDGTQWLNTQHKATLMYVPMLKQLAQACNAYLYSGIKSQESHFACYLPNDFYAVHSDNPQGKQQRLLSVVWYLTAPQPAWSEVDHGQLRLQDAGGTWHKIMPTANRLVIFNSNLLHEVLPTKRIRHSITAWLRSDPPFDTIADIYSE